MLKCIGESFGDGFSTSTEVRRTILAERVLGPPQDVRVDLDIPFNKLNA
jgi:hypothetical protein